MVVWDQYSPNLQARMESFPNFKEFERESDCLKILTEIRSTVYQFKIQTYLHNSMLQAREDLVHLRQTEEESNNSYRKRFREQLDMIKHYEGSFGDDVGVIKDEFRRENIDSKKELKDDTKWKGMDKYSIDRTQEMAFLRKSNKNKYEELLIDLINQYSRKNDQYPNDLTES